MGRAWGNFDIAGFKGRPIYYKIFRVRGYIWQLSILNSGPAMSAEEAREFILKVTGWQVTPHPHFRSTRARKIFAETGKARVFRFAAP